MAVDNVSSIDELTYVPEMPEKPRPIVSIGTGGIVQGSHYPAYKLAGYPVIACYDVNLDNAKKAAAPAAPAVADEKIDESSLKDLAGDMIASDASDADAFEAFDAAIDSLVSSDSDKE